MSYDLFNTACSRAWVERIAREEAARARFLEAQSSGAHSTGTHKQQDEPVSRACSTAGPSNLHAMRYGSSGSSGSGSDATPAAGSAIGAAVGGKAALGSAGAQDCQQHQGMVPHRLSVPPALSKAQTASSDVVANGQPNTVPRASATPSTASACPTRLTTATSVRGVGPARGCRLAVQTIVRHSDGQPLVGTDSQCLTCKACLPRAPSCRQVLIRRLSALEAAVAAERQRRTQLEAALASVSAQATARASAPGSNC